MSSEAKRALKDAFAEMISEFSQPQAKDTMMFFLEKRLEETTEYECEMIYARLHDIFKDPLMVEKNVFRS